MPQKKKLPFVTVGFVAVNVLVYVILEILGNTENSEFWEIMTIGWVLKGLGKSLKIRMSLI